MKNYPLICILILSFGLFGCEIEPYEGGRETDTIAREDALYNYLGHVSKTDEPELTDVACIEFLYPFKLFIYDTDLEYVRETTIGGNDNFASVLANLEQGYSIGLSYPISGVLADGTILTVDSNEDLQKSLESCILAELETIISGCNGIVQDCVWQVANSSEEESVYLDSIFDMQEDGSIVFKVSEEEKYRGTWIFYFIGYDLHLNINFGPESEEQDAQDEEIIFKKEDWNFDWTIRYMDEEEIVLENNLGESYTLKKVCAEEENTEKKN